MRRAHTSGPITVTLKEGMVTVAERTYVDTKSALDTMLWPDWMVHAMFKVAREAEKRRERNTESRPA